MPVDLGLWDYNVENMHNRLVRLRDRYFRPTGKWPKGDLTHHGDCYTYRAIEVYGTAPCTCGFLHDLRMIDDGLSEKLYPYYGEDYARQEGCKSQVVSDGFLEKHFPNWKPVTPTQEQWEACQKRDWSLIEDVFGGYFRDVLESDWRARNETQ